MHEMALVTEVVDAVVKAAQGAGAKRVNSVYMTIGDGRDVVQDLFSGLFDHFAQGTVAQGASLCVDRTPFMVRCRSCGKVYHLDVMNPQTWPCPSCGKKDYELVSGMEFRIEKIEVA